MCWRLSSLIREWTLSTCVAFTSEFLLKASVKLWQGGFKVTRKTQFIPGPKENGWFGPVVNLKPFMNKFVVKRHFKMETISVAREFINSNDYLASEDLSDVLFPKRERVFYGGIQTPRNKWNYIVSRCLDTPIKHEARVLEITSHDHSQANHKQRLPIRIVCYLTFLPG